MNAPRACHRCGYPGSYATTAPADTNQRRHTCAAQLPTAERAPRRGESAQSRIRRDCSHPRARHVHGTRAAYVKDRCRCTECTAANTAASRAAHRARTFGRWQPFVDAAPVRHHVRALRAAGVGVEWIATLAGVATSHVRALAEPGPGGKPTIRRVRPDTARRVLGVGLEAASRAPRSRVDATGTRRRLQALIAIGWPERELADRLHRSASSLRRSMISETVTAKTADHVDALYQWLWNTRPPTDTEAKRAAADAVRANAAGRGWLPPLAWDDIDNDPEGGPHTAPSPPEADIDPVAVARATAGDGIRLDTLTRAEQQEVINHLTRRGRSIRDIAQQLATTKRTVSRRRASLRTP